MREFDEKGKILPKRCEEGRVLEMNSEFFEALDLLEKEKGIPVEFMYEKIKNALVVAVKSNYKGNDNVVVNIDPVKKEF